MRETTPSWIKGNNTIVTRAMAPAQQQQGHLCIDNGYNAIVLRPTIAMVMMAKMPLHQRQWCHCKESNDKQRGQQC
jgi:hypothetical protein